MASGISCGTPPVDFIPTTNPIVGTAGRALTMNGPTAFGGVNLGTSATYTFPVPLPIERRTAGVPGCYLLQSNKVSGLPATPTSTPSTLRCDAPVPSKTASLGQELYMQST